MSESFVITTTVERTLSELASYHRDQAAEIEPVLLTLDSRNFHWLELKLKGETTRIEAIREHPQPDREHQWQWPESFRVIHEKKGQHSERLVKRGQRGEGISTIEICGFVPHEFSISRMMRRKSFISFSFTVGRQTKCVGKPSHQFHQEEHEEEKGALSHV